PVHAAAERLVLRVAAPAERVVLPGTALRAFDILSVRVGERQPAGDPVRAVLAHLDGRLAGVVVVRGGAPLYPVDREAERAGRAGPDRGDDLVNPSRRGADERLLAGVKHPGQPVGAVAGVLADAAVVVDRQSRRRVGIAPVGHPLGVLGAGEAVGRAGAVAGRLHRGLTAAAQ